MAGGAFLQSLITSQAAPVDPRVQAYRALIAQQAGLAQTQGANAAPAPVPSWNEQWKPADPKTGFPGGFSWQQAQLYLQQTGRAAANRQKAGMPPLPPDTTAIVPYAPEPDTPSPFSQSAGLNVASRTQGNGLPPLRGTPPLPGLQVSTG